MQYACPHCPKSFNREDNLRRHQEGHNKAKKPELVQPRSAHATSVDMTFKRAVYSDVRKNEKNGRCQLCHKFYANLYQHMHTMHEKRRHASSTSTMQMLEAVQDDDQPLPAPVESATEEVCLGKRSTETQPHELFKSVVSTGSRLDFFKVSQLDFIKKLVSPDKIPFKLPYVRRCLRSPIGPLYLCDYAYTIYRVEDIERDPSLAEDLLLTYKNCLTAVEQSLDFAPDSVEIWSTHQMDHYGG